MKIRSQPRFVEADPHEITQPVCAIVKLAHQPAGVFHRVVLDPEKQQGDMLRLGDWPGDEAAGWQMVENLRIVAVLGYARLVINEKTGQPETRVDPIHTAEVSCIEGKVKWA